MGHGKPRASPGLYELDFAVDGDGDFFQGAHHVFEGFGGDGLGAVGEGVFGVVVGFDDEAIGAGGDGGFAHVGDEVGVAGALAGVDDDGEVADAMDFGDDGQREGVAGVGFEGADAALAEDDVGVSAGHDVFGGEEEFFEGGGEAALEEDGFVCLADGHEGGCSSACCERCRPGGRRRICRRDRPGRRP